MNKIHSISFIERFSFERIKNSNLADRIRRCLQTRILSAIDDYAKDGGKELFTKMHCIL